MEITVYDCLEQRLTTMDAEFTKENTTWFDGCTKNGHIYRITDLDGGLLISESGYYYPIWIGGLSRADASYSKRKALNLKKRFTP
jgi:hypothetical protein